MWNKFFKIVYIMYKINANLVWLYLEHNTRYKVYVSSQPFYHEQVV